MLDFARARYQMVEGQLRTSGVLDRRILHAVLDTPREVFVPEVRRSVSYLDEPLPVGGARSLPAPAPWARLVQLAEIGPADRVLEIASGTGYGLAVLARLAASVVGLEEDAELAEAARRNLAGLGAANVEMVSGPLPEGAPEHGPFDVIVVSGAVERLSKALFTQLAEGGRLVAVEGFGNAGIAHLYVKSGRDVVSRPDFNASMPELAGFATPPAFTF